MAHLLFIVFHSLGAVAELLHLQKSRFTVIAVAKNLQYDFWGPSKFGGPRLQPFSLMANPALPIQSMTLFECARTHNNTHLHTYLHTHLNTYTHPHTPTHTYTQRCPVREAYIMHHGQSRGETKNT